MTNLTLPGMTDHTLTITHTKGGTLTATCSCRTWSIATTTETDITTHHSFHTFRHTIKAHTWSEQ